MNGDKFLTPGDIIRATSCALAGPKGYVPNDTEQEKLSYRILWALGIGLDRDGFIKEIDVVAPCSST